MEQLSSGQELCAGLPEALKVAVKVARGQGTQRKACKDAPSPRWQALPFWTLTN